MSEPKDISASEALSRVFKIIVEEASANPTFARRLVAELGAHVKFSGADAVLAVDPVLIAARNDQAGFREQLQTMPEASLKKMITDFGLGTAEDVRAVKTRPKKIGYIELLWTGACIRLNKRV